MQPAAGDLARSREKDARQYAPDVTAVTVLLLRQTARIVMATTLATLTSFTLSRGLSPCCRHKHVDVHLHVVFLLSFGIQQMQHSAMRRWRFAWPDLTFAWGACG